MKLDGESTSAKLSLFNFTSGLKGPFACQSNSGRWVGVFASAVALVLTQIGGLFMWVTIGLMANSQQGVNRWIVTPLLSMIIYLLGTFFAFPLLAQPFGRVPLDCYSNDSTVQPKSVAYCIANRHYVTFELSEVVERLKKNLHAKLPGRTVYFLDAGFPLGLGFPMLPHLSHGDGRRLDLMFLYQNKDGEPTKGNGSPIGYFAFTQPKNTSKSFCPDVKLTLRWNLKWLQPFFSKTKLDDVATSTLLGLLVADSEISKVLLEPHLKERLGVKTSKIRFQGCRAARHDDHMHIQL